MLLFGIISTSHLASTFISIRVVLEVGNRTKTHAADLGRQVDILPDDIRNFLQRWIIVQVGRRRGRRRENVCYNRVCRE